MKRFLLAVTLLASPTALAQEEPDDAEVADAAPESTFLPPRVDADPERRRAIRGAYPPEASIDPEKEALREFEQEAFAAGPAAAEAKPLEDRPDIDWLKKLRTGDVPVRWDRRVVKFLEFYRDDPRGRALMTSWLKRQGRFKDMILSALRRHGLPEDLIYISMIESSYDPLEVSRVGASGLWQFMPAAGRVYGLRQDHWIDERFDPEKANEAQMLYFKDLYARFGNWELAAAAFNCGYGCVLKSMAKYGTNDFWALLGIEGGLPWESSVYVPKFLAAAIVGRNLSAFGFDHVVLNDRWAYDKVTVPASVDLATVARAAGVDLEAVKRLNPALRRGRTPPGVVDYEVRIPEGTQERFARSFPQLRLEWEGTETYVIRHGERFEDVAATYGISQTKLRELNGVRDIAEVRGGTILVVPSLDAEQQAKNRAAAEESLYHSDVVPGGPDEPLLVAVKDKELAIEGKQRVFYRVVAGDTLREIAGAFGLPPADLAEWNGLDVHAKLAARMVLMAFVPPDFDLALRNLALLDDSRLLVVTAGSPEHLDIYEGRKGRVRQKLIVKAGDTLDSIGRRYSLTQYDMARINRRSYTTPLVEGEELVVYKVVDREKAKKAGVFKARQAKKIVKPRPVSKGKPATRR